MNAIERFMDKVQPVPICGCWIWEGYTTPKMGYGMFWLNGSMRMSHRVSYEFFNGPIHGDLQVCHRCDVPACVNPNHLWLGTNDDNVQDKMSKGRAGKLLGEKHPRSKVNETIVRLIRTSSDSSTALASQFGLDRSTVKYIRSGRLWGHVQ
jgi:hypothetical protein